MQGVLCGFDSLLLVPDPSNITQNLRYSRFLRILKISVLCKCFITYHRVAEFFGVLVTTGNNEVVGKVWCPR